jgi:hypothetical protein
MAKMMCEVLFDEIKTEHTPANLFAINTIFQINISNKTHTLAPDGFAISVQKENKSRVLPPLLFYRNVLVASSASRSELSTKRLTSTLNYTGCY